MDEFTRHVFATLTYTRTKTVQDTWKTVSSDFNRYLQRFRRSHNEKIQYLRVVERHKDLYPHIHIIIQFPDASIRVRDFRWFDRRIYQTWKALWKRGHSDYQKPRRNKIGTISYMMKYLLKNTTRKTIWKKLLASTSTQTGEKTYSTVTTVNDISCHIHNVKLCTWSRGFDWEPFKTSNLQHNDDC